MGVIKDFFKAMLKLVDNFIAFALVDLLNELLLENLHDCEGSVVAYSDILIRNVSPKLLSSVPTTFIIMHSHVNMLWTWLGIQFTFKN